LTGLKAGEQAAGLFGAGASAGVSAAPATVLSSRAAVAAGRSAMMISDRERPDDRGMGSRVRANDVFRSS
jgi:hypothetical protein